MGKRFRKGIPREKWPEPIIGRIPDDVLKEVIHFGVRYSRCPYCDAKQFHPFVPGHNYDWECKKCDRKFRVVG